MSVSLIIGLWIVALIAFVARLAYLHKGRK